MSTATKRAKRNRRAGHNYERELAIRLREIFPLAATARNESRSRDAAGVDLVNTGPLNIQAKAWAAAPSYHTLLKDMPDEPGQHNTVFHKRPRQGTVVVMPVDDFLEMVATLVKEGIWKS